MSTPDSPRQNPPPTEERAREICLRALDRRRRTRRELVDRLRRKGIPESIFNPVLDRLSEVGLVDDEAYARAYIETRQRTRPRGPRALAAELAGKGVAREIVEAVLGEFAEQGDPVEEAGRALQPRLRGLRTLEPPEARRKAAAFLQRRGFSYDVVRTVLDQDLPAGDPWDES